MLQSGRRRRSAKRPAQVGADDVETLELQGEARRKRQSLAAAGAHLYNLIHRTKKARVDAHEQSLAVWEQLPPTTANNNSDSYSEIWTGMESRLLVRASGPTPLSPVHRPRTSAHASQGLLSGNDGAHSLPHETEWRPSSGSRAGGGAGGGGDHFKQLDNLRILVADREEKKFKEQQQQHNLAKLEQQKRQQELLAIKQQQQAQDQERNVQAAAAADSATTAATAAATTVTATARSATARFEPKLRSSDMVAEAMQWRQHTAGLQAQVDTVQTKFRKMANKVKVQVNHLAGTITSLHVALHGSQQGGRGNNQGVQSVLEMVRSKQADLVPGFMQVVADRIVQVAAQGTAPDVIKNGESNFALAYMAVALCVNCPGFLDCLMGALCTACPYIVPGLRTAVEAHVKANPNVDRRMALGYEDNEKDAVYLSRMQAIISFYGALLQTNVSVLGSTPYNIVPPNSPHPLHAYRPDSLEPIAQAWRWLAGTLNGTKWRWVRYLAMAFVASCGHELQHRFGADTVLKLIVVLVSPEVEAACDKGAKFPDDTDRKNVFRLYFAQIVDERGSIPPPGRFVKSTTEGNEGAWVDKRNLPMKASQNLAQ